MKRWYLVHTKSLQEAVAEAHLTRQGFRVYCPRLLETVRVGGSISERERIVPLFPRYLFLQLDEGQQALAPVRSSVGVACIVRFGVSYGIVPDAVVGAVRERADSETGLHRLNRATPITPGTRVMILAGATEIEGVFERSEGADRVTVLLGLLGRQTRVRVPAQAISLRSAA